MTRPGLAPGPQEVRRLGQLDQTCLNNISQHVTMLMLNPLITSSQREGKDQTSYSRLRSIRQYYIIQIITLNPSNQSTPVNRSLTKPRSIDKIDLVTNQNISNPTKNGSEVGKEKYQEGQYLNINISAPIYPIKTVQKGPESRHCNISVTFLPP